VAPVSQPPHGGNAYAGIIVYDPANYREYLTGTLAAPLLPGAVYEVSFYVSLLDNCLNGIAELGAWFTATAPSYANAQPILLAPQFQNAVPVVDDTAWTLVKGTFQAAGGEQYVILGCFVPDAQLSFTPAPGTNSWFDVYYFIDDVSVVRDSATGVEAAVRDDYAAAPFPNPATESIQWSVPGEGVYDLLVTDALGRTIHRSDIRNGNRTDCSRWPSGIYLYRLTSAGIPVRSGRMAVQPGR
jgi:hypothetical protein